MPRSIHDPRYVSLLKELRRCREAGNINQVTLAERLNLTQSQVSKWERGERRIDVLEFFDYLEAVQADALNVISRCNGFRNTFKPKLPTSSKHLAIHEPKAAYKSKFGRKKNRPPA